MSWARGALLGGALALAACGRSGSGGGGGALASSRPGDCPNGVTVRLIGTNQGNVSALRMFPGQVGVSCAPAAPVCVMLRTAPLTKPFDLSSDAVVSDLGAFSYPPAGLPPNLGPVDLTVHFGPGDGTAGGSFGLVDQCIDPIHVTFDPGRVNRDRCSVTILLDVGRSLVPTANGFTFLPQFRVFF
jgi:hypothetical protein